MHRYMYDAVKCWKMVLSFEKLTEFPLFIYVGEFSVREYVLGGV